VSAGPEDELDDVAGQLPLPEVPSELSARLRSRFRDQLPVVSAMLVSDSRSGGQLAGARGAGQPAWTMSYEAGRCDVLLDVVPTGEMLRLTGQLLCPGPTSEAVIRAYRSDELVAATSTDQSGQFDLAELRPSVYTVAATTDHDVVELVVDLRSGDPA
jgi:hypothetical protein